DLVAITFDGSFGVRRLCTVVGGRRTASFTLAGCVTRRGPRAEKVEARRKRRTADVAVACCRSPERRPTGRGKQRTLQGCTGRRGGQGSPRRTESRAGQQLAESVRSRLHSGPPTGRRPTRVNRP